MASTGNIWWMTPLQAFAILGAAVNFGGSALQSPLIMPMLQLPDVPSVYAGKQTAYLLHNSEKFFPPLNMLCTLSNLALTVTSFMYRDSSRACAEKLPYVGAAFGLSAATTAYALLIMVPMNRRMAVLAGNLEANHSDDKSEKELRHLQQRWTKLNLGRASIMIGSAIVGMLETAVFYNIPITARPTAPKAIGKVVAAAMPADVLLAEAPVALPVVEPVVESVLPPLVAVAKTEDAEASALDKREASDVTSELSELAAAPVAVLASEESEAMADEAAMLALA
ncbi:hypothetical protein LTR36_004135 [Oleoguttula mirabilis]|uniref:DUF1772-domain-containing protein n=1 Tax=Oleoguttula mirabilis TaxID=1507867 RepID=A0AAV9JH98_9PEZI|nr:hypothetical protein LTR36_004135 [Oleoguttula mirabilis]